MANHVRKFLQNVQVEPQAAEQPVLFAEGLCFYKLIWIFGIGCLLGYLIETVTVYIGQGQYLNRAGMVWGPFNQIYGFGAVVLSLALIPMESKSNLWIFMVGTALGGVFEYLCSFIQEKCFRSISWDYTDYATSIGGRTNLLYMMFWGVLAVAYTRWVYPVMSGLIERIQPQAGAVLSWVVLIFFAVNLFMSAIAVTRWNDRTSGIPAEHPVAHYLDRNYHDERMEGVYPEMIRLDTEQEGGDYDDAA